MKKCKSGASGVIFFPVKDNLLKNEATMDGSRIQDGEALIIKHLGLPISEPFMP
jgi:hypothetical protein